MPIIQITTPIKANRKLVFDLARSLDLHKISTQKFNSPEFFTDEMVSGAFKSFKHQHIFEEKGEETLMKDIFDFTSPLGSLGRLADKLVLIKYMTNLLEERNKVIKDYAETDLWKSIIQMNKG